ncbi:MAG: hypothetical protein IJK02_12275 [Clostridia bacterium]|nr:hypothetical protein [Clostridia bacterium]
MYIPFVGGATELDKSRMVYTYSDDCATTGDGVYNVGDEVTVTAYPNDDENQVFVGWYDANQITYDDDGNIVWPAPLSLSPEYTFTVTDETYLYGRCTYLSGGGICNLSLTTTAGGTVTGGGKYGEGTAVTMTATPAEGYDFVGWFPVGEGTEQAEGIPDPVVTFHVPGEDLAFEGRFEKSRPGFTVKYHEEDQSPASAKTTKVPYGVSTKLRTLADLGFNASGSAFVGWKAQEQETGKWRAKNANGAVSWVALTNGKLPSGYTYVYYPETQAFSKETQTGNTVHLYAQWTATVAIGEHPNSVTAAENAKATFSVKAYGVGLTYAWRTRKNSSAGWTYLDASTEGYDTDTLKVVAKAELNGYQFQCVVTDAQGNKKYSTIPTLTVKSPGFTSHPANATVAENAQATFKVTASGVGITYAWRTRANSSASWTYLDSKTEGYNKSTLKFTATAALNGYQYQCVITDAAGTRKFSTIATLTVQGLAFTLHPVSVTAAVNAKASFHVTATGSGITYAWRTRADSSTGWTYCTATTEGYNTDTLKVVAKAALNGYQYQCVITDAGGNKKYSTVAMLSVKEPAFTSHPSSVTVSENTKATFKVTATGVGITYAWRTRANSSAGWTYLDDKTEGYNTDTLKVVAQAAFNGYQYQCVITDAGGNKKYSTVAKLTVVGLGFTSHPKSTTVAENAEATFKVTATGDRVTYAWRTRANSSAGWTYLDSKTTGYNTDTLKVVAKAALNGYQYQCVITDAGDNKKYSTVATLTVKAPAFTSHPASTTAAENAEATFKVTASGVGITYAWRTRANSSAGWTYLDSKTTGYNTDTLKVVAKAVLNGYQYQCVITDAGGNKKYSTVATLTVKAPAFTSHPSSTTVANNATATFKVTATGVGITYAWRTRANSSAGWTYLDDKTEGYNTDTLKVVAKAALNGYQYQCVITDAGGNKKYSTVATLTVK